ncbi:uncharacterized protein [Parasteatoda tepidariorum]|uniref:uncharacterized protein n=1 Tax=Parasteatoda tepidariorum TaxID=114398 RepID=UPI0039BC4B1F
MEPEIVETKPAKPEIKESTRTSRGRKSKTEVVDVESEAKPKPSRRSARSSSNKEETPKKRPSRSIQAKRYTEDDEEDIEEIGGSKAEEEIDDKVDGTRKRKRESSPEETNKRVKEDENETTEKNIEEEKDTEEPVEEKIVSEKQAEEPMEVEECDSGIVSQDDSKSQEKEDISVSADDKITLDSKKEIENVSEIKDVTDNKDSSCLEKTAEISTSETKQEIESSTARDSKQSEEIKEDVKDNIPNQVIPEKECENQTAATINDQASDKPQPMDSTSESEQLPVSNKVPEINSESSKLDTEKEDLKNTETHANDISESKNCESKIESSVINVATENIVPAANAHSVTDNSDSSLNGTENLSNSVNPISVSEVPSINVEQSDSVVPKANGAHDVHESTNSIQGQCILPGRKYTLNSKLSENIRQSVKNKAFGFLSYNLGSEYNVQKEKLLHELHQLNSQIICLQQVPKPFYSSVLEPSLDALGYKGVFCQPEDSLRGMATFFKTSQFRLNEQAEISLRQLVDKELETSALEPSSKAAVKSYIKRCGNALLTHFASVIGTQTVNVLNVQIPPSDLSAHALQVSSLAREVIRINGGTNKPLLIGGEFNISENDASYQLLRDGYLSNDMIDELQRRKDIAVPEKENSSLVDLLWKSFQHPSSSLCSCYSSVLGHELLIPELKRTSSDLLWYSSDSLHTVGIVDVDSNKLGDRHFSLKADVAFSI